MSRSVWREALKMRGEERTVATRQMRGSSSHAPTSPT
jgi:DNA-binding FadR family transcriptional regulator